MTKAPIQINEKKQAGFQYLNNWQQCRAIKKAITSKIKKKGGADLVSWAVLRRVLETRDIYEVSSLRDNYAVFKR